MAGEYVEFVNNSQPALNEDNLNLMQQRIKQDIQGAVSGDTLPIGCIIPFGSDTIPENWLLCNGQAVSRTTYSDLYNTIGTTFGQGDGFSTFNLPNLQGKTIVGKDANDTDFDVIGETSGAKTVQLTPQNYAYNSWQSASLDPDVGGSKVDKMISASDQATYGFHTRYGNTNVNTAINNLQPYQVQNYIIKAKQSAGVVATIVDSLNSTSATDALSANQGRLLKGITLFANANGVGSGTNITLNETSANFDYIEIFYGRASTENTLSSVKVANPNTKQFGMSIIYSSSNDTIQLYGARMEISGTNVTWSGSTVTTISGTSINSTSATDIIKVYKIVGYK